MDYLNFANSWVMWMAVIPAILLVLIQSAIMVRRAVMVGKKLGLTNEQFKHAVIASAASSIGPSIVVATGCVTLIVVIGGPLAWMRLAYIGSVAFELVSAQLGATAAGATLGAENMTMEIFATCVWTMCLGCLGWIIVSALFTDKMDKVEYLLAKGDPKKLTLITSGAMLGAYGYLATNQCLTSQSVSAAVVALVVAAAVQAGMVIVGRKKGIKWMPIWAMTFAMFSGLAAAALCL